MARERAVVWSLIIAACVAFWAGVVIGITTLV